MSDTCQLKESVIVAQTMILMTFHRWRERLECQYVGAVVVLGLLDERDCQKLRLAVHHQTHSGAYYIWWRAYSWRRDCCDQSVLDSSRSKRVQRARHIQSWSIRQWCCNETHWRQDLYAVRVWSSQMFGREVCQCRVEDWLDELFEPLQSRIIVAVDWSWFLSVSFITFSFLGNSTRICLIERIALS